MKRNPRYCKAYLRASAAAMALQRPSEALPMFQQALQLKPKSSKAKVCIFISNACFCCRTRQVVPPKPRTGTNFRWQSGS
jgi:hypothetical protein